MDRYDSQSASEIQADLSDIERDLTLRQLLWQSQEEWDKLYGEWTATPFDSLQVEQLQKNVNRFTQTVYMLEKGEFRCVILCFVLTFKIHYIFNIVFILDFCLFWSKFLTEIF